MTLARLRRCFCALAVLALCGAPSPAEALPDSTDAVVHALNRLGYGPRPGDVEAVRRMGLEAYLDAQLHPERTAEPAALASWISACWTLHATPSALFETFSAKRPPKGQKGDPADKVHERQGVQQVREEAVKSRLLRALNSPNQLQEVMVEFWFNHFNVSADKGLDRFWIGAYEEQAIRPHALGKFSDLLYATATHPAMLFYLDNWQNSAPGAKGSRGRFKGLNENYAREIMELHTLGVDGGYTQADVTNLARVLTGWGFNRPGRRDGHGYDFRFAPGRHDFDDVVVLGRHFSGGEEEGRAAIEMLADSPVTAHHLAYQLAQYFVDDNPPTELVDALAARWVETHGDIRDVLGTLFHSDAFWSPRYTQNKFKAPYRYLVSALRAAGADDVDVRPAYRTLNQAGMPPYGFLTPNGYDYTQRAWLSPDAMTRRISLAVSLSSGKSQLAPLGAPIDPKALETTLAASLSSTTLQTIGAEPRGMRAALILGSPDFMRF